MDRYAVIGHPVAHSQSPFIHGEFARQTGQAMAYERLPSALDGFADRLREFADGGARGCNITVPFKFEAFAAAARRTERATLARAANTLRFDADGWLADNTDGVGLVRDIEGNAHVPLAGKRILMIGAGGAAAGALGPLLAAAPALLVVANRSVEKARALVARHQAVRAKAGLAAAALADCGAGYDVVVNATAASLNGSRVAVASHVLGPGALALDMMYGAPAEEFLGWVRDHGAQGRDGLGMLVEQAAVAFELWRGVRPETASVLAALRARLKAGAAAPDAA